MADDKTKRGSPDSKRLNKSEPYEVAYAKSKKTAAKKAGQRAAAPAKKSAGKSAKTGSAKTGAKTTGAKSAGSRASPKSASPAMKRTNAAPARAKAPKTRGTPNPPKAEKTTENTAPKTMREPDAVDLLVDDHLEVSALFKQYDKLAKKNAPSRERQPIAQTICAMLKAHTTIEEEIFYPAARRAGLDADQLDEADIEHASAKDLIAQIEGGDADDDHYDAKVKVLGEYITHHVVEEHTEMFPKCRRASMDLVGLRGRMQERKDELTAGAPPAEAAKQKPGAPGMLAKLSDTLFSKG